MEQNDDPIYGLGYQQARRALEQMPLRESLTFVCEYARPP